ncbi:hypothetical protein EDC45_0531 [Mesocricetibacter intestinalis]|uniref:Uncharacterized protein n=1 Tax=Mesocricetibacter intestinalis TaxID=1521930 RepID=A0A4R6VGD1_9PAST|nr:DUF5358 family protein [Mesocricetibacter intestinalis]TDQ59869.1 hypothetical protein EDC45_0531 [Mesocricetibacter intestinalis]
MLKKLLLLTAIGALSACSFGGAEDKIPAQFAGADYQLSDENAQKWVSEGNQREQCIYPNLTRIQQEHFSKEDAFIYSQYIFFYPLEDIIGSDNLKMIKEDPISMDYVTFQRKKFKDRIKTDPMDTEKCEILRKQARADLAVVKGEYRNAMAEEPKTGSDKSTDKNGNSLEKSKFSFDILKWGIGLMLL